MADVDEYFERNKLLNILGKKLKYRAAAYMPDYISSRIKDMGVPGVNLSGVRILIPPVLEDFAAIYNAIM